MLSTIDLLFQDLIFASKNQVGQQVEKSVHMRADVTYLYEKPLSDKKISIEHRTDFTMFVDFIRRSYTWVYYNTFRAT